MTRAARAGAHASAVGASVKTTEQGGPRGLMQKSKQNADSKIPFLGDIPLLGNLFRHKVRSDTRTELIIFLTPHIVMAPSQLAALTADERARQPLPPKARMAGSASGTGSTRTCLAPSNTSSPSVP